MIAIARATATARAWKWAGHGFRNVDHHAMNAPNAINATKNTASPPIQTSGRGRLGIRLEGSANDTTTASAANTNVSDVKRMVSPSVNEKPEVTSVPQPHRPSLPS